MINTIELKLPLDPAAVATLKAGQFVTLSGTAYTARDATHKNILDDLLAAGQLPYELDRALIFYAGPTPPRGGRAFGSIGPTTARRMDEAAVELMDAGIGATLGKGIRSQHFIASVVANGAPYFGAVGGIAALLARHIVSSDVVAYRSLGCEALTKVELDHFPAFVAIDCKGRDFYSQGPNSWREGK